MYNNELNFSDNLESYFKSINKSKGLPREKEAELGKRIKNGDESAVMELVEANLQFVVRTAKQYIGCGVPLEDLISEGNLGLVRAAEKFDFSKGKKFITYAVWWIRSFIQDAIKFYRGNPNEGSIEDYVRIGENGERDYDESAEIVNNEYEEKLADLQSRNVVIDDLITCLQERESKILSLYFGLHGEPQMNLKEISKEVGLSSERVRQIVNDSILRMKATALSSKNFEEYKNVN